MTRVLTIWPTDRHGVPVTTAIGWLQSRHWCVIDVSAGWNAAIVVEGPLDRNTALRREQELRADDHAARRAKTREPS